MVQIKSAIISNERLNEDCWRLTLKVGAIASEAKPGQFVNVRISEGNDPLFRRPFSIFRRIALSDGTQGIQIVYKIVGRGTRTMATLTQGDQLDVIGPMGHGFEWFRGKKTHVLLGGGTGAASLFMLGEEISDSKPKHGLYLYVLLGADTDRAMVLEKEFASLGAKVLIATDDGTRGYRGTVIEMLTDGFASGEIPHDCAIYACGPEPMLAALSAICTAQDIPAQVSLEKDMMCGLGACLVCVCRVDKKGVLKHRNLDDSHILLVPEKDTGYALSCKDGPVFHIDEVVFDQ